jgi:DNA-binding HxlR family transcriptional regulator
MTAALPSRVCDLNPAISHRMLTLELRKLEDAGVGRS